MIFRRAIRIAMAGAATTTPIEAAADEPRADAATRRVSTVAEATDAPRTHIHRGRCASLPSRCLNDIEGMPRT
ncbi:hypothetical protein [Lysobacter sp. TAB13]|uniref:hypothetical protein n=1 Tax=Lysobacter sp. TAB13 TaxID=3233065 RepID=UPI003F9B63F6